MTDKDLSLEAFLTDHSAAGKTLALSREEYELLNTRAEGGGVSFEKELSLTLAEGMKRRGNGVSSTRRATFAETLGARRAYSYTVDYPLQVGTFSEESLPEELVGEIEGLSQSDECPFFLLQPAGEIEIRVAEE